MSKLTRAYRDLKFHRALKRFRQDHHAAIRRENDAIVDLVGSWGNQRWSALDEFLIACLHEASNCDGFMWFRLDDNTAWDNCSKKRKLGLVIGTQRQMGQAYLKISRQISN